MSGDVGKRMLRDWGMDSGEAWAAVAPECLNSYELLTASLAQ